jgi:hypothetical protein
VTVSKPSEKRKRMHVTVSKFGETRMIAINYEAWINKIVKKGLVSRYEIIEYPDLAELVISDSNGREIKRKIIELLYAKQLSKENPSFYDYVKIDNQIN